MVGFSLKRIAVIRKPAPFKQTKTELQAPEDRPGHALPSSLFPQKIFPGFTPRWVAPLPQPKCDIWVRRFACRVLKQGIGMSTAQTSRKLAVSS